MSASAAWEEPTLDLDDEKPERPFPSAALDRRPGDPPCGSIFRPSQTSPAPSLDQASRADKRSEAARSVDALVASALKYRASADYQRLLQFVRSFRSYAPFNALLIHVQRPGAQYVAPAERWLTRYGRILKPGAQPIAILQPFGPIMFVFDVDDTVAKEGAPALPEEVVNPFEVRSIQSEAAVAKTIARTMSNAARDGVRWTDVRFGSSLAGRISCVPPGMSVNFQTRRRPEPAFVAIPHRYDVEVNANQDGLTRYATMTHELAHLYCGHLGTPNPEWWPDRSHIDHRTAEFEAESVSAMTVWRLDSTATLPPYLAQHLSSSKTVPSEMSLERVMQAAGHLIEMGSTYLPVRSDRSRPRKRRPK